MTSQGVWVGVDFGTCWSSVAINRTNFAGEVIRTDRVVDRHSRSAAIPTAVAINRNGDLIFGHSAWRARQSRDAAVEFKRDFGEATPHQLGDHHLTPVELTTAFLTHLRELVAGSVGEDALSEATVTITVPASYEATRRELMVGAASAAGFPAPDVVAEPVAAARAALDHTGTDPGHHVLIYDLGGGTFDAAIARTTTGDIEILAERGLRWLGGRNFDTLIQADLLRQPAAAPLLEALRHDDVRTVRDAEAQLGDLCRSLKHDLTDTDHHEVKIPYTPPGAFYELSRTHFDALAAPLIDQTLATCDELLEAAGLGWTDLDRTILVGGATLMPIVTGQVAAHSDQPPHPTPDPHLAVAHGAALPAPRTARPKTLPDSPVIGSRRDAVGLNADSPSRKSTTAPASDRRSERIGTGSQSGSTRIVGHSSRESDSTEKMYECLESMLRRGDLMEADELCKQLLLRLAGARHITSEAQVRQIPRAVLYRLNQLYTEHAGTNLRQRRFIRHIGEPHGISDAPGLWRTYMELRIKEVGLW